MVVLEISHDLDKLRRPSEIHADHHCSLLLSVPFNVLRYFGLAIMNIVLFFVSAEGGFFCCFFLGGGTLSVSCVVISVRNCHVGIFLDAVSMINGNCSLPSYTFL